MALMASVVLIGSIAVQIMLKEQRVDNDIQVVLKGIAR